MRTVGSPFAGRVLRAGAVFGALVLGASSLPAAAAAQTTEPDDVLEVTGGSLTWGVRHSIRNYLENFGHTEGWVAAADGATYAKGDAGAVFPAVGGEVDLAAGTASLSFDGSLEMFGFGEDWLYFDDVRIEIADGEAAVVVDLIESYNVKEPVDDFTLAVYTLDEDSLALDTQGRLVLTTAEGVFSEEAWASHLPQYGGPTYAPPNDYTDPLSLSIDLAAPGAESPGGGDDDGEDGDGGAGTGPYGVSTGSPLSGTTAYIRVTPGYALDADGETTVTIEGFHFDPGPAGQPGTGSGGIYVGLGTMKNPGSEAWRRSKGGTSGPVGAADYTYGLPLFVGNQNSADADVADGVMDASGHWSAELTIPGKDIDSFFGDGIDCVELSCGIFSFGAHGVVKAANEAFTPVYFAGQDDSTWPDRDDDDPTTVPPVTPERPDRAPDTLPTEAGLTAANRGDVQVLSLSGRTATVFVGAPAVDAYVGVSVYSDPQFVDWYLVPASGRIEVVLPAALPAGAHKLSVITAEEELIGWAPFELAEDSDGEDPDGEDPVKGEPYGTSTGTNPYTGATLTVTPAWSLSDSEQRVDLKGTGYATSSAGSTEGGAYVLFGWIDPAAGDDWGPGAHPDKGSTGQSGVTYTYAKDAATAGTYQTMVNYPGNVTGPGLPFIQADGSWEITGFPIQSSRFESTHGTQIDCYVQQCGIITIGAHGKANAGVEVFTPLYFTDERPPNTEPPSDGDTGLVDNPNLAGGSPGLSAATGWDAPAVSAEGRTLIVAGVLLFSLGVFGAAVVHVRARRGGARPVRPVA
ncbi:HtaA domain-containing protein [Microbacterium tumbae]